LADVRECKTRPPSDADVLDRDGGLAGCHGAAGARSTLIALRPRAEGRRFVGPVAATLTALAAVLVLAILATGGSDLAQPDARAAIAGNSDPAVRGEARLYGSTGDGGTVQMKLRDVPPAPSGHHYEVWVLRRNGGGQMEAIGSFTPTSNTVTLDLPLPGLGDYAGLDISIQQDGGSSEHSTTSLAGGAFS
jgi:hypothetical protein